jgi:hypothetical protein
MSDNLPTHFEDLPASRIAVPLIGRGLGLVLPSVALTMAVAFALLAGVVRFAMLEPTLSLFIEDVAVGQSRLTAWVLAPVLGASTKLSEVLALVAAGGVVLLDTLFLHQVMAWWSARGQRQTFLKLTEAGQHDEIDEGQLALWQWGMRKRERGALIKAGLFGLFAAAGIAADAYSAGIRTVLKSMSDWSSSGWDLANSEVALLELPRLWEVVTTGAMVVAGPDGEAQLADLGALSEGVIWTASAEVLLAGVVPALALALAARWFMDALEQLLRHVARLIAPALLALRNGFLRQPLWSDQAWLLDDGSLQTADDFAHGGPIEDDDDWYDDVDPTEGVEQDGDFGFGRQAWDGSDEAGMGDMSDVGAPTSDAAEYESEGATPSPVADGPIQLCGCGAVVKTEGWPEHTAGCGGAARA